MARVNALLKGAGIGEPLAAAGLALLEWRENRVIEEKGRRIRWAPKLRPDKLVRLYKSDAMGMRDDELLDDVAWTLYARVRDVIRVSASRVVCPQCTQEFHVRFRGEEPGAASTCPGCGWTVTANEYHRSWEHQDLNGHSPEFERYVERLPNTKSPQERMLLVDGLVHALHTVAVEGSNPNFAARNLLQGSRPSIAALLDRLAYGDSSTVDVEARERWQTAHDQYARSRRQPNGSRI